MGFAFCHLLRTRKRRFGASLLLLGLVIAGMDQAFPPDLSRYEHASLAVVGRDEGLLRLYPTPDRQFRVRADLKRIDTKYPLYLKTFEDKRFDYHLGVDPLALARATWQWIVSGRIVSGASTLTMQIARMLEPRPRKLWSKFVECLRAVQLEARYSKPELLEIYATLAPFGGNIEGVETAAQVYFGKSAKHLTVAEAALLAAIPQSPSRLRPDRHPEAARLARAKVLSRLLQAGVIGHAVSAEALKEPVPHTRVALPLDAPHLAQALRQANPHALRIKTSLNPELQRRVQQLVKSYAQRLPREGSVAVLVVENTSRQVLAYVGSRAFTDVPSHGYVDMVQAVRSPGSTLKPALFALSFDALQSHPQTLIWDQTPSNALYTPGNFDGQEHGQVTVANALQMSLNIPAIKLMARYGPIRFAETLTQQGFRMELPGEKTVPNLAMALGGVGTSLQDLVQLYRGLASDRKLCPLQFLAIRSSSDDCAQRPEMVGKTAQDWTRGILQAAPRPAHASMPIAFKTGTSYGYRDAWALGYDDAFTVGVWTGQASGAPIPGQTGLSMAAPLLFSVFQALPYPQGYEAPPLARGWLTAPPDRLRFFDTAHGREQRQPDKALLDIRFPPKDSVFALADIQERGMHLRAEHGKRPLAWLVNGAPISSPTWKREAVWHPPHSGFYTITVLDQNGQHASRRIRVQ